MRIILLAFPAVQLFWRYFNKATFTISQLMALRLLSVLCRCWLGGRKGIRPVKKLEWWGAVVVICLERGADLHMAQLMPQPLTVSCFSKTQIGFTFLALAHLGSPGKRAVNGCVCVMTLGLRTCNLLVWLVTDAAVQGLRNVQVSVRPSVFPVGSRRLSVHICRRCQSAVASGQRHCCDPRRIDADLFHTVI